MATEDKEDREEKKTAKKKDAGPQDLFTAVSKAVAPLSSHLDTIAKHTQAIMENTKGGGAKPSAEAKFEGKNMFSKMFAGIANAIGGLKLGEKKDDKGIFGWIKDNWGKLLIGVLALGPLLLPLDTLVDMWHEWMPKIKETFSSIGTLIMEHPIMTGISAALLAAFGPSGVLMALGGILKGGVALAKFAAGAAGPIAIVAAIAKTIYDGIMGAELAGEWGVSKTAGVMGAILGGTGKGVKNAFMNAGKWAILGATLGSVVPIVGTVLGGVIGAVVGGVLGWIGGEKISQMIQTGMNKLGELWDGMIEGLGQMVEDFNVYLIQPIKEFGIKAFEWISNTQIGKMFGTILEKLEPMMGDFKIYLIDPLVNFFGKIKDNLVLMGEDFNTYLIDPIVDLFSKVTGTFSSAFDGMKAIANKMIDKINVIGSKLGMTIPKFDVGGKSAGGGGGTSGGGTGGAGGGTGTTSGTTAGTGAVTQQKPEEKKGFWGGVKSFFSSDEDKHTKVKEHQANMGGVAWNKLGGRDTIEDVILTAWNEAGISKAPTFTSGYRPKDHKLSLSNPRSQHIQKTAFDLRSKDLSSNEASGVFSRLMSVFGPMGIWGQHEKGSVNAKNRSGEHFHFQLAAKGFSGTVDKATGFIAGEDGPERVDIIPLNDPSARMAGMNKVHDDRMASQEGTPSINVITSNQTNNSQDQSSVILPSNVRPGKPIQT